MHIHTFRIKKYINGVGFYAEITLDVDLSQSDRFTICYDDEMVDSEWKPSLEFGIRYFFEHYFIMGAGKVFVKVKRVHVMIGDSSSSVVFFATVKCLCEMLGYQKELITFDEKEGAFILLK